MRCSHCGLCCQETEMLLSQEDITSLKTTGYPPEKFQRRDRQRYAKLRNRKGYCFFYDAEKRRCKAYRLRPRGCRLYPVICSVEDGIIVDELCPMGNTVSRKEIEEKGKEVLKLLAVIDREAQNRKKPLK
jgi:Fe-S-cluster containining protein